MGFFSIKPKQDEEKTHRLQQKSQKLRNNFFDLDDKAQEEYGTEYSKLDKKTQVEISDKVAEERY